MKKIIIGIFAHPDDEAAGPSATLMKEVEAGAEVQLICVTRGEGGMNPDNAADVGAKRLQEWHKACDLIGASATHNLGYGDGTLCNNLYQEICETITNLIKEACARLTEPTELCLMTFSPSGVTGHLDHIAVSSITTQIFYKLAKKPSHNVIVKELAYYCLSEYQQPKPNPDYFVFMPAGEPASAITRRVDVRNFTQKKYDVIRAHQSQRQDGEIWLAKGDDYHAVDNFIVISA